MCFVIGFVVIKMLLYLNKIQHESSIHINFQKMLFINMVSQIFLTAVFEVFPFITLFSVIYFKIIYSGQIVTVVFNIISFHAPLEMMSTLYLVKPYREYLVAKLKDINYKGNFGKNIVVPSVSRA